MLEITRGDDFTVGITIKDDDGNAIDITGWTFYLTVKKELSDSDADALIQEKVTSHTDPTNGKTEFELSSDQTDVNSDTYYYDIQGIDNDEKITTFVNRRMKIVEDVTKSEVV